MLPNKHLLDWKCAILAVKKYKGITSAKVVDEIKHIVQADVGSGYAWLKFGHGGTLDESATGVLAIGTGLGCKLLTSFLQGVKCYKVKAKLGVETDTLNECGQITKEMKFEHVTLDNILAASYRFKGQIFQLPPKYSALKFGGSRSSDLTRAGIEVALVPREVHCYSIAVLDFTPPFVELEVKCGGGFYIRSLVRDLACCLETCGHVTDLHRVQHGFLMEKDALPKEDWTYSNLVQNARLIRRKAEFKRMFAKFSKRL